MIIKRLSEVAKANEPSDQKEIERISGLFVAVIRSPTTAEKSAEVPIPIMIKAPTERAQVKVSAVAISAPTVAKRTANTEPTSTRFKRTPITTPRLAPAEVPKIAGSANGLFAAVCAIAPAKPSAAPIKSATRMRGMRICQRIKWLVLALSKPGLKR